MTKMRVKMRVRTRACMDRDRDGAEGNSFRVGFRH